MNTRDSFKMALSSLWANKLRTVLTLLGVVIGVSSVIAVVTLVNGANRYVAAKIVNFGADVFSVQQRPSVPASYEEWVKDGKRKALHMGDYQTVAASCRRCVEVGASAGTSGKVVVGRQGSTGTQIRGYTAYMPELANLNVIEGRSFTQVEEEHATRVAIIGADIEQNLFQGADPIGRVARINGVPYTVIGLGESKGKTLGQSQDDYVVVPLTTYLRQYGADTSINIAVKTELGPAMEATLDEVRVIMRSLRHDRPGHEDSFTIETSESLMSLWGQIAGSFEAVAVGIAAISLVVGGIVIMNIMLVSVTERTREIGVRKALGARRSDLMLQFLIESATMALVGGAIGVLLGVGAAQGVTVLFGFPSSIAVWSIFAGLFVATSVGVFFGVYPARKAADLDPIVALRSEF